jgi:hypothetical protein
VAADGELDIGVRRFQVLEGKGCTPLVSAHSFFALPQISANIGCLNWLSILIDESQDPDELVRQTNGLCVRGRGANHQVDVLGEFAFTPAFSLPIRLSLRQSSPGGRPNSTPFATHAVSPEPLYEQAKAHPAPRRLSSNPPGGHAAQQRA